MNCRAFNKRLDENRGVLELKRTFSIDRFFKLSEHKTTVRTELTGGLTTFMTMLYVFVIVQDILVESGIPKGPITVSVILMAVLTTILMWFYSNRRFALAPCLGSVAFL